MSGETIFLLVCYSITILGFIISGLFISATIMLNKSSDLYRQSARTYRTDWDAAELLRTRADRLANHRYLRLLHLNVKPRHG